MTLAIIGLGYVGLPLAVEFAKRRDVIGFDINAARIAALQGGHDATLEVADDELRQTMASGRLRFTTDPQDIAACTIYIVTVPTPITEQKRPDLRPLLSASKTVGQLLKPGDLVIYESTVYPGCTEEDCVPVLERESGLKYISAPPGSPRSSAPRDDDTGSTPSLRGAAGDVAIQPPSGSPRSFAPRDDGSSSSLRGGEADVAIHAQGFYVGYSPERINPGDTAHRVSSIQKVTSGSTPEIAETVDALYREIITAGTHKAESIRVAEAAKVIENTQRDLNIALMNELSVLFARLGIDTEAVLKAAGTNWRVSSLVEKTYKNEVATLQNGSVGRLQTCPITAEDALDAAAGYLAGSAKWYTWKTEEALKRHRAFKELGVESFRSKAARALRDEWLERKSVGFIHQAARYRGKANYREALFLAYGSGTEKILSGYLEDMHAVLRAFLAMAGAFACRRLGKALWSEFVADVDLKKAFTTRPGDVWA